MELAFLFKMPLFKLLEEMSYQEYACWVEYLKQRPPGRQEDYRAAMIMSSFGGNAQYEKIFPSLAPRTEKKSNIQGIKHSFLFQLMRNAKGDDLPSTFYEN